MVWIAPLSAILAALLTAVVGNRLVHVWQERSWRHRQQFQGLEKEYTALKILNESIAKQCGDRLSAMRELHSALLRGEFNRELENYRASISDWNKSLSSHYAQLIFQLKWEYAKDLEQYVHERFVVVGQILETEIRSQNASNTPSRNRLTQAELMLNSISGYISIYIRDITRKTEERRQEVFYGTEIKYNKLDIIRLSDVELIKLLFNSNVDDFSVVRPSNHIAAPLGRGL